MSLMADQVDFQILPKVELHAHLTGSISRQTLHEVWLTKCRDSQEVPSLKDPLLEMPNGKHDYDIKTFFPLFSSYIYHLVNDVGAVWYTTLAVLRDFADDGVVYLELRTTPRALSKASPSTQGASKEQYVKTVLEAVREFEKADSRLHTKLILSVDRRNTLEDAMDVVRLAKLFQNEGVVGIDLCGNPLQGDIEKLAPAFAAARAIQPKLGITLHFAEVAASGTDEELSVLLKWQPDRLGHVIHLREAIKRAITACSPPLGLELCLSCNVQAGMITGGFAEHHFGEWWQDDRCVVVPCTDDVGVFGSPLSNEYRLITEHFGLTKLDILRLVRRSADVIFGGEQEQARIRHLVDAYGPSHTVEMNAASTQ